MANQTIIPVGNQVEGNITSCLIDNQVISIQRNSALSFVQKKTYASYDVCSRQIIQQYTVPTVTDLGIFGTILGGVFVVIILCTWINAWGNK